MDPRQLSPAGLRAYQTCQNAMIAGAPKTVSFEYTDAKGQSSRREVEPYEIKDGQLFGHCLERNEIRRFKLDAMSQVLEGRTFIPRHRISVPL